MRKAGLAAGEVLDAVAAAIEPGVTTDELDAVAHDGVHRARRLPEPARLPSGFPKSVCTSVNEVICHGIPNDQALQDGDIVNVDVTIYLDGVHGDTNATFAVGESTRVPQLLMDVTRECLGLGDRRGEAGRADARDRRRDPEARGVARASAWCARSAATRSARSSTAT